MEPRIQYARASDGVSIAYARAGEGFPLIATSPLMYSNISIEFRLLEMAAWYEQLAAERLLVRFDWRGMGMSERNVEDFRVDTMVRDVEAVVDALGCDQVDLLGIGGPGQEMVAYAVHHPQKVRRLVLWDTPVNNLDILGDRLDAVLTLANKDWDLFCETFAHNLLGWSRGELGHQFAAAIRASIEQKTFAVLMAELVTHDVTDLLERVTAPTLVLHQQRAPVDIEHARTLASRIPDCQIVQLDDQAVIDAGGEPRHRTLQIVAYESVRGTQAVLEFLREGEKATSTRPSIGSGMTAILFADIVDSTALTERMGDTAFREKARELDAALRAIIRANEGTPIEGKLLGDGVLAVFTSARQAIEAALACAAAGENGGLPLHLGIHAGDVIHEGEPGGRGNVYGGAVNIAARISALSAPGQVLVSQTMRDLARTSAGVSFGDGGEHQLKGVGEPVRVWSVTPPS